jgi:hypothetical protein
MSATIRNQRRVTLCLAAFVVLGAGACSSSHQTARKPPAASPVALVPTAPTTPSETFDSFGRFTIGGKEVSETEFFTKFPGLSKYADSNTTTVNLVGADGKEICKAEFFRPIIIQGPTEISPMESGPGHIGNSLIGRIN